MENLNKESIAVKPVRPNPKDYGDIRNDHSNFRLEDYITDLRAYYKQVFEQRLK